jgi:hypothetical protein
MMMSDAPAMREVLGEHAPKNWRTPLKVVNGTGAPVNPVAIR